MSLQANNLTVGYGNHAVVADVNASLIAGHLTILIGANGSGKSTLLRTITGSQPPLSGIATINGEDIAKLSPAHKAKELSLVLTDRTGGGGLLVEELVAIGRHPYTGFMGRLSQDDRQIIADAIHAVGLDAKRHSYVASLSDGERQKAMIARAIAQATDVIVLDEPTSFLDVASRFEIMRLLGEMSAAGKTILLSTHDIAPAMAVANDIWAISNGRLHAGSKADIIESGLLNELFPNVVFDAAANDFRQKSK